MKLHFVNKYNPDAQEHTLSLDSVDDFQKAVDLFPQLEDSVYKSNDLRQIAKDMASYLSSHHMKAWITEE